MKPHNLKMIKKRLRSNKGHVPKKGAFIWNIKDLKKDLCRKNKVLQDAKENPVMEYVPSLKHNKKNRSQGLKSLCFQPVPYSSTPLQGCVKGSIQAARLFPTSRVNDDECYQSCQTSEFDGEIVKTWKISNELQEISPSLIELATLNQHQQRALLQILDWISLELNKLKLFVPLEDSSTSNSSDDAQEYESNSSSSSNSSVESNGNSSTPSYGLRTVDPKGQRDFMSSDCSEDGNNLSSLDGSEPDDKNSSYESSAISDEVWLGNNDLPLGELGDVEMCSSSKINGLEHCNQGDENTASTVCNYDLPSFPLSTLEEFFVTEDKIKTSLTFRIRLAVHFSSICEKNQRESAKKILEHSLDKKVAGKFSHQGIRTKKAALNQTKFYAVIKEALQMRYISSYNDAVVNSAIAKYLGNIKKSNK